MNRLEAIENFKKRNDEKAALAQIAKVNEYEALTKQILDLQPRIAELIDVGNACLKNGIKLECDTRFKLGGRSAGFIAEGICHHVGFIKPWNESTIYEMGIINGGWFGDFDFHTDGRKMYSVSEKGGDYSEARIEDMRKFVKDFDEFEQQFYDYVDDVTGNNEATK